MTNVTLYQPQAQAERRSWVELMAPAAELAKSIAGTDFVPKAIRNSAPAIAAAILYGDEVGLGPMQSLAKVHVIEGRPALAAESQRALVLAAGHELWLEEATTTRVTWAARRRGSSDTTRITWTLDDAKRAGLQGRGPWRTYPRAMLSARASAELVRAMFPDVIGGLPALEELEDGDVAALEELDALEAEVAVPEKPKAATRKRTAKVKTPAMPVSAPPEPEAAAPSRPPLPGEEPAEVAAEDPGPEEPPTKLTPAQRLAMKANDVGLSEELRHGLILALTGGRTQSGKDLDGTELATAMALIIGLDRRTVRLREVDGAWLIWQRSSPDAPFGEEPAYSSAALEEVTAVEAIADVLDADVVEELPLGEAPE